MFDVEIPIWTPLGPVKWQKPEKVDVTLWGRSRPPRVPDQILHQEGSVIEEVVRKCVLFDAYPAKNIFVVFPIHFPYLEPIFRVILTRSTNQDR